MQPTNFKLLDANTRDWLENPSKLALVHPEKIHRSLKKLSWRQLVRLDSTELIIHSIYADLLLGDHYIAAVKLLKLVSENDGILLDKLLVKDASFLVNCLDGFVGKKSFYTSSPAFRQLFSYQSITEYAKMDAGIRDNLPSLDVESVEFISRTVLNSKIEGRSVDSKTLLLDNNVINSETYTPGDFIFELGAHGRFVVVNLVVVFFDFYLQRKFRNYPSKVMSCFYEIILEWHGNVFKQTLDEYSDVLFNAESENAVGSDFYQHIVSTIGEKHTLSMYFPCKSLPNGQERWVARAALILHMMDLQNGVVLATNSLYLRISPMNLEYLLVTKQHASFRKCLLQSMAHLKKYKKMFPPILYIGFVMKTITAFSSDIIKKNVVQEKEKLVLEEDPFEKPFGTKNEEAKEENTPGNNKHDENSDSETLESRILNEYKHDFIDFVRYLKAIDSDFRDQFQEVYASYKTKLGEQIKNKVIVYTVNEMEVKVCLSDVKFVEDRLDKLFLFGADEDMKTDGKSIISKKEIFVSDKFTTDKITIDEMDDDLLWDLFEEN